MHVSGRYVLDWAGFTGHHGSASSRREVSRGINQGLPRVYGDDRLLFHRFGGGKVRFVAKVLHSTPSGSSARGFLLQNSFDNESLAMI